VRRQPPRMAARFRSLPDRPAAECLHPPRRAGGEEHSTGARKERRSREPGETHGGTYSPPLMHAADSVYNKKGRLRQGSAPAAQAAPARPRRAPPPGAWQDLGRERSPSRSRFRCRNRQADGWFPACGAGVKMRKQLMRGRVVGGPNLRDGRASRRPLGFRAGKVHCGVPLCVILPSARAGIGRRDGHLRRPSCEQGASGWRRMPPRAYGSGQVRVML